MSNEGTLQAWINPLDIPELTGDRAEDTSPTPVETTLAFLCPPGTPNDANSLVARYKRISTVEHRLFVIPTEAGILEKLVWPLRNAKASYVLGNNLAAVALCGVVAEMVALLLWELHKPELNGKALTEADERALFGSAFEKLSQYRRMEILRAYGIVPDDVGKMLDTIRSNRRRYLHHWSQGHASLSKDAEQCFRRATGLVVAVTGQDFSDGTILLDSKLLEYLEQEGTLRPSPDSASTLVE